jgi:hypothetical protein
LGVGRRRVLGAASAAEHLCRSCCPQQRPVLRAAHRLGARQRAPSRRHRGGERGGAGRGTRAGTRRRRAGRSAPRQRTSSTPALSRQSSRRWRSSRPQPLRPPAARGRRALWRYARYRTDLDAVTTSSRRAPRPTRARDARRRYSAARGRSPAWSSEGHHAPARQVRRCLHCGAGFHTLAR